MNQYIVYEKDGGGIVICIPTGELPIDEVIAKDIPAGKQTMIIASNKMPQDIEFFDAFEANFETKKIIVNVEKAKIIAHEIRRQKREAEFAPYDDLIAKQIPKATKSAEAERVKIREKYDEMQQKIDASKSFDDVKFALN